MLESLGQRLGFRPSEAPPADLGAAAVGDDSPEEDKVRRPAPPRRPPSSLVFLHDRCSESLSSALRVLSQVPAAAAFRSTPARAAAPGARSARTHIRVATCPARLGASAGVLAPLLPQCWYFLR